MSKDLWPRLDDIRLNFSMLSRTCDAWSLSDAEYRALMSLVATCAAGLVWTYSEPGDGSLPDDDNVLARIARLSLKRWRKARQAVAPFFTIEEGRWHLREAWIAVDAAPVRFAIPREIREIVRVRQGDRCTYCGTIQGPFEYDHILPVAKGGSNEPSNLTLACASCNRAKRDLTLREWIGR